MISKSVSRQNMISMLVCAASASNHDDDKIAFASSSWGEELSQAKTAERNLIFRGKVTMQNALCKVFNVNLVTRFFFLLTSEKLVAYQLINVIGRVLAGTRKFDNLPVRSY